MGPRAPGLTAVQPGGATEAARPRAELGAQDGHGTRLLTAGEVCRPLYQTDPLGLVATCQSLLLA